MANLNKVLLMGNLTRDPELRYAPNGTAVTTFTIAMGRVFNSASGEKKEDVCYVRIVCWAKLAQICGEYLFKGRPVFFFF
jgi:single-strand DNA-binding protein